MVSSSTNTMTFSEALAYLKRGGNVTRKSWQDENVYLELIAGADYCIPQDAPSTRYKDSLTSWIGIRMSDGNFGPWTASQADLLAEDWTL